MPDTDLQKQAEQVERTPDGRFAKGRSGNPAGRPPGLRNHAIRAAELLLDGEAEALTRKAVALALGGDVAALRLCLACIVPKRRDRPVRLPLPAISQPSDVADALDAIVAAVAAGEITPGEAVELGKFMETLILAVQRGVVRWRPNPWPAGSAGS